MRFQTKTALVRECSVDGVLTGSNLQDQDRVDIPNGRT